MEGQAPADVPPVNSQTIEVPIDENTDSNARTYEELGINPNLATTRSTASTQTTYYMTKEATGLPTSDQVYLPHPPGKTMKKWTPHLPVNLTPKKPKKWTPHLPQPP